MYLVISSTSCNVTDDLDDAYEEMYANVAVRSTLEKAEEYAKFLVDRREVGEDPSGYEETVDFFVEVYEVPEDFTVDVHAYCGPCALECGLDGATKISSYEVLCGYENEDEE